MIKRIINFLIMMFFSERYCTGIKGIRDEIVSTKPAAVLQRIELELDKLEGTMIDKSHTPRNNQTYSIERIEAILWAALEHSSHGWHAFEKETNVNRLNPDSWPPQVEAAVGSAQYHLANVIALLYEAYQLAHQEQQHNEEVMKKVNATLGRSDVGN